MPTRAQALARAKQLAHLARTNSDLALANRMENAAIEYATAIKANDKEARLPRWADAILASANVVTLPSVEAG